MGGKIGSKPAQKESLYENEHLFRNVLPLSSNYETIAELKYSFKLEIPSSTE